MTGCFVTGTDTAVGKTVVASAILYALQRHHRHVIGMKPIAAGAVCIAGNLVSEDVVALRSASTICVAPHLDNPFLFAEPLSPHIASERDGERVDICEILRRYHQLSQQADFVVVEGAGGFLVPLTKSQTGADLARALSLPVVLVVGLRLGCLNHALLTVEAIRARGLTLAGWVANLVDPAMEAREENIAFLCDKIAAPLLADIPHLGDVRACSIRVDLPQTWMAAA